jgi:MFS family permease
MPVYIILFAWTRSLPLALFFLGLIGFSLITIMNNSNAMVQSRVPDILRGRVMALYSLMFMGGGPVGSLMIGAVATWTSEPLTAVLCAVAMLLFSVGIWFYRPEVRSME